MRIILDCDPGNGIPATDVDDGLAIALALASPDIELEAITIVSGNTPRDVGYAVARTMMDSLGLSIPVYAGAATALVESDIPWTERRNAKASDASIGNIWDGVPTPGHYSPNGEFTAAAEIVRRVSAAPGEVTLVAVGPLTNIAHALQLYPQLAQEAAEIVIMGGAFEVPGFLQELNFGIDPEAARVVLASGANITLVPLDVTSKTLLTQHDLDRLETAQTPLSRYLVETTRPWIAYCETSRGQSGCWLHDPLAVAVLIDRSIATVEDWTVDVEVSGLARSRPIKWRANELRMSAGLSLPNRSPIKVLTDVNNEKLVTLMLSLLSS